MLLCFPGELSDRFLFWLREPPMATAGCSLGFSPVAPNGGDLLRPDKFHLCFSFTQSGSASEAHTAPLSLITHLSSGEHPASPLLSPLMLWNQSQKYTCAHVNSSACVQPLRSNISLSFTLSLSSCTHTAGD